VSRVLLEPPARLPVSLVEARAHQRISAGLDDDELTRLIREATATIQTEIGLQLVAAKWRVGREEFPLEQWTLRPWPLLSIDSIAYVDGNGDSQTLSSSRYIADTYETPGNVSPAYGYSWPAVREQPNAATADIYCGCAVPVTSTDASANAFGVGVYVPANATPVWLSTDGTLPEGLSADTTYYIVGRDASAKTIQLAATSGGAAIDFTDQGSGQHWLRLAHPDVWDLARRAILLLCDHWWEHRGDQVESTPLREITYGVQRLLNKLHPGDDFVRDEDE